MAEERPQLLGPPGTQHSTRMLSTCQGETTGHRQKGYSKPETLLSITGVTWLAPTLQDPTRLQPRTAPHPHSPQESQPPGPPALIQSIHAGSFLQLGCCPFAWRSLQFLQSLSAGAATRRLKDRPALGLGRVPEPRSRGLRKRRRGRD